MVKKIIVGTVMILVSTVSHGVYLTFKRHSNTNDCLYHITRTYIVKEDGEQAIAQKKTETTKMTSDIKALKLEFDEGDRIEISAYIYATPCCEELEPVGAEFQIASALKDAVFVLSENGYEVTKN